MTFAATPLSLWAAMAAEASGRIYAPVYAVSGQVVAPVRHILLCRCVVFNRWFKFNSNRVTVAAKALPVTHGADIIILFCNCAVMADKCFGMIETFKRKFFIPGFMTLSANREIFSLNRVTQGNII
jgi:hypothetical protein